VRNFSMKGAFKFHQLVFDSQKTTAYLPTAR